MYWISMYRLTLAFLVGNLITGGPEGSRTPYLVNANDAL